jgi:hypothetical protein
MPERPKQSIVSYANIVGEDPDISADCKQGGDERKYCEPCAPVPDEAKEKRPLCRYFVTNNCRYGSYCRYSHDLPDSASMDEFSEKLVEAAAPEESPDCGICMGSPEDGHFGLLNACDCVFCLKCIREWRKEGLTVTNKSEQVR